MNYNIKTLKTNTLTSPALLINVIFNIYIIILLITSLSPVDVATAVPLGVPPCEETGEISEISLSCGYNGHDNNKYNQHNTPDSHGSYYSYTIMNYLTDAEFPSLDLEVAVDKSARTIFERSWTMATEGLEMDIVNLRKRMSLSVYPADRESNSKKSLKRRRKVRSSANINCSSSGCVNYSSNSSQACYNDIMQLLLEDRVQQYEDAVRINAEFISNVLESNDRQKEEAQEALFFGAGGESFSDNHISQRQQSSSSSSSIVSSNQAHVLPPRTVVLDNGPWPVCDYRKSPTETGAEEAALFPLSGPYRSSMSVKERIHLRSKQYMEIESVFGHLVRDYGLEDEEIGGGIRIEQSDDINIDINGEPVIATDKASRSSSEAGHERHQRNHIKTHISSYPDNGKRHSLPKQLTEQYTTKVITLVLEAIEDLVSTRIKATDATAGCCCCYYYCKEPDPIRILLPGVGTGGLHAELLDALHGRVITLSPELLPELSPQHCTCPMEVFQGNEKDYEAECNIVGANVTGIFTTAYDINTCPTYCKRQIRTISIEIISTECSPSMLTVMRYLFERRKDPASDHHMSQSTSGNDDSGRSEGADEYPKRERDINNNNIHQSPVSDVKGTIIPWIAHIGNVVYGDERDQFERVLIRNPSRSGSVFTSKTPRSFTYRRNNESSSSSFPSVKLLVTTSAVIATDIFSPEWKNTAEKSYRSWVFRKRKENKEVPEKHPGNGFTSSNSTRTSFTSSASLQFDIIITHFVIDAISSQPNMKQILKRLVIDLLTSSSSDISRTNNNNNNTTLGMWINIGPLQYHRVDTYPKYTVHELIAEVLSFTSLENEKVSEIKTEKGQVPNDGVGRSHTPLTGLLHGWDEFELMNVSAILLRRNHKTSTRNYFNTKDTLEKNHLIKSEKGSRQSIRKPKKETFSFKEEVMSKIIILESLPYFTPDYVSMKTGGHRPVLFLFRKVYRTNARP